MKQTTSKELVEALSKIGEAITSDLYLEDILKLIVNVTAEVTRSKICSLMLLDQASNELVIKATQSVSEFYNKKPNLKLGQGIAGKVAQTGKPITVLDVRKDEHYMNQAIAKKEHLCSLLSMPLAVKGKTIGVLNCYTVKPHSFSPAEINVIRAIANQAAIVIENYRLVLESHLILEELETRKFVDRAKGVLMKRENLTEQGAYKLIQKYSMDKRKSMREVSEAILINDEMRKYSSSRE